MIHVKSLLFRIVSDTVFTMLENIADQAKLFTVFLHEELKNWIHECGYTTRELEEITGINKDKISRAIYRGQKPITVLELDLICKAIEVNPTTIIRVAEAKTNAAIAEVRANAIIENENIA